MVLFIKVSDPAKVANVPVALGNVIVAAPFVIEEIIGAVNVLPVSVCVPAMVTILADKAASAIEAEGKETEPVTDKPAPAVNNPEVEMVLFVNVSVPAKVANVPVAVGNVTVAAPFVMDEITGVVRVLFVSSR
ncbi:MAG: hypothetical protein EBY29_13120 [Planctomycetes bacterium]|nr:hypothetical protein [Planctomycetota bacterium]